MSNQTRAQNGEPTFMDYVHAGLSRLTPDELRRLDEMITPETARLLSKAYGPGMATLLWPLIANDQP